MNKFKQVSDLGHQMSQASGEGGPQVNKFDQVSSLGHQMFLPGGLASGVPFSGAQGVGRRPGVPVW